MQSPDTRHSLLVRLRDVLDQDAWRQFVHAYTPVVYRYARKRGLQDADADDLTQDVMRNVATALAGCSYERRRGPFRAWLFTVVHHRWYDFRARQRRGTSATGDSAVRELLEEQPSREEDGDLWDREYQHQLFSHAAEQVRGQVQDMTWQAFWQTAVEGRGGQAVAQDLGMTVAAVYLAKSRVMARLRQQVRLLTEDNA